MDDNYIDDDYGRRGPMTYEQQQEAWRQFHSDIAATPPEKMDAGLEAAKNILSSPAAKEVLNPYAAATTEDQELLKRVQEAEKTSRESTQAATSAASGLEAGKAPGESTGVDNQNAANNSAGELASSGASSNASQVAEKPTSLESSLAQIRMNPDRQRRLVISGDPMIERAFYDKLAEMGHLKYQGGAPVITTSRKNALKILQETAGRFEGAEAKHALSLTLDRDGGGIIGSIRAGLGNNILGRRHEIDVVVVGKPDVMDAKLKELGSFVREMSDKGYIPSKDGAVVDGKLVVKDDGPQKFDGSGKLYDVVTDVKNKVEAFNAEKAAKDAAVREFKSEKDYKSVAEARSKASPEDGADSTMAVNKHAAKLAKSIASDFQDPNLLYNLNEKKQVRAMALLQQARGLSDPSIPELGTLAKAERQTAVVQLAALVAKTDAKEFGGDDAGKLKKQLDHRSHADTSTIREKVDSLISSEAARDPDFAKNAKELLNGLVERKILSEEQATALNEKFAKASEATQGATRSEASTQSEGSQQSATQSTGSTSSEATTQSARSESGATSSSSSDSASSSSTASSTAEGKQASHEGVERTTGGLTESGSSGSTANTGNNASSTAEATQSKSGTESRTSGANEGSSNSKSGQYGVSDSVQEAASLSDSGGERGRTTGMTASSSAGSTTSSMERAQGASQTASLNGEQGDSYSSAASSSKTGTRSTQEAQDSQRSAGAEGVSVSTSASVTQTGSVGRQSADLGSNRTLSEASSQGSAEATSRTGTASTLRDRIEAAAAAGPARLSESTAHNLVAGLDAIRTKPLSSLDAGGGTRPTETLVRTEAILGLMQSGKMGAELQALAGNLKGPVDKWNQQDAIRYEKDGALITIQRQSVMEQLRSANANWSLSTVAAQAASGNLGSSNASQSGEVVAGTKGSSATTSSTTQAGTTTSAGVNAQNSASTGQPNSSTTAQSIAKDASAQRLWETESAGAKLSSMMSNPAGSFTNRDKTWNTENIQKAANEVLRIDPEAAGSLSAAQRTKVAAYSAWIAENAKEGKLPGFSSESGKEMASQLVDRAAALIGKMDEGSKIPSDVQKSLDKGDRLVSAMDQLQKSASATRETNSVSAERTSLSPAAAKALANDMVHSVYRQSELNESQAKYLLKNAVNLTPDAIKSLDPQSQAKTAVAIQSLAESVRSGAMGAFDKLPGGVQKQVSAAQAAADTLMSTMSKDPSMRAELNQAYSDLSAKTSGQTKSVESGLSKSDSSQSGVNQSAGKTSAGKADGRSLDR